MGLGGVLIMKGHFREKVGRMDDDQDLLRRYDQGDDAAFTELVKRHQERLYHVAYRMVGNMEDSLDLVQKTFVRLFTHRGTFRGESRLSTWLYRILINFSKNYFRDSSRKPQVSGKDFSGMPDHSESAVDHLQSESSREELRRIIQDLPEKQQLTIILRVYEELSYEEVAEVLNCSVGTAKSNFHHGLVNLRRRLKEKNIV